MSKQERKEYLEEISLYVELLKKLDGKSHTVYAISDPEHLNYITDFGAQEADHE
jgi:hypothetical protein